ncbi:Crp/Fnr family transcriptional regulator [Dysgonomonas sp. HDW5A]|uniref:Crp/Fnr family transcriptional regulator n=1 Tax=Dysgonomonas sp. HDW5A TaxID=2714926 RepID=UPI00140E7045|nr:Crp/Fnr family transcriptional regulator [Dysgonomonas sp. HDW5A]QIK59185.1 Crp/Fnr family transcriptional regulator [Dysgonomonas sp. HDW5A]
MINSFISHINRFVTLSQSEIDILTDSFEPIRLEKKEILHQTGKVATSKYFVSKGCLRSYFINDKGIEQILQFAIENWWIADYESLERKLPSTLYIDAVESSEILSLTRAKELELYNRIHNFETYFRQILERERTAFLTKIRYNFEFTKEEAYLHFSENFPEFIERIPDYMIASYLNFTPEYLSVIRKRIIS